MKKKRETNPPQHTRHTNPKILFTAIAALICIALAFIAHWTFILPAVVLWWLNKRYINKHFGV